MADPKDQKQKIKIIKDGPYLVSGAVPLGKDVIVSDKDGFPIRWEKGEPCPVHENYSLCRCGESKNKPFCDGAHVKAGFDGKETADRAKYIDRAEKYTGPELELTDVEKLCAIARFCVRAGDAWTNTEKSDSKESRDIAIQEACDCPAGRIVAWDKKTGQPIETKREPSIGLVEDPPHKVSGPLWVKGGIPVESSDGACYEVRTRVTLCRCGKSKNKPFCDGQHIESKFKDGDKSIE
jgi:CDGSH-type Zn-finger protein